MTNTGPAIRILPIHGMTGAYDIRQVDGAVLIHLGDVKRDGREWTAQPRNGATTRHATRRDAVAALTAETTTETVPAEDLAVGDVIATAYGATWITRVARYGSIGYGTRPIVDVHLVDGGRRTFMYGQEITRYVSA
jgi:hypothetical protein